MPATYEPIATTTLGSAASSITFSSISGTYTDLRIVIVGTSSGGADVRLRFNSDSGSNYSFTAFAGWGSGSGTSFNSTNNTYIDFTTLADGMSSTPKMYTADIFSYAGSTNKTVLTTNSEDNNTSGKVDRRVHLWRSTSAITSIALSGGTFDAGTIMTLYGILKA